jgi:hypothetical protein
LNKKYFLEKNLFTFEFFVKNIYLQKKYMFKIVPWSIDLDLTEFYKGAAARGFENNSTQKMLVDCFQKEDWGYLANNTWYFITNIEQKLENYICEYRSIQRKKDDFDYEEGKWLNLNHAMLIKDEVFEVLCKNKRKMRMNKNNTIDYQGKQKFYIKIKQIY